MSLRRFVNLLMENSEKGVYSLRRLNLSRHPLFYSSTEVSAVQDLPALGEEGYVYYPFKGYGESRNRLLRWRAFGFHHQLSACYRLHPQLIKCASLIVSLSRRARSYAQTRLHAPSSMTLMSIVSQACPASMLRSIPPSQSRLQSKAKKEKGKAAAAAAAASMSWRKSSCQRGARGVATSSRPLTIASQDQNIWLRLGTVIHCRHRLLSVTLATFPLQ